MGGRPPVRSHTILTKERLEDLPPRIQLPPPGSLPRLRSHLPSSLNSSPSLPPKAKARPSQYSPWREVGWTPIHMPSLAL